MTWLSGLWNLPSKAAEAAGATAAAATMPASGRRPWLAIGIELLLLGMLPAPFLFWRDVGAMPEHSLALLLLAPLLAGLRHGSLGGAAVALCGMAAMGLGLHAASLSAASIHVNAAASGYPAIQAICMLLAGMAAGEARDAWQRKLRHFAYLRQHDATRLAQFAAAHQTLQYSHARLERQCGDGAFNLRAALERLTFEPRDPGQGRAGSLDHLGERLLDIFTAASDSHCAAVYGMQADRSFCGAAVASMGNPPPLAHNDPLLRAALASQRVTSASCEQAQDWPRGITLVPLIDATGHTHGVVSIHDMPFLRMQRETFDLLSVMGQHVGDLLSNRLHQREALLHVGVLHQRLHHHLNIALRHDAPATLVAFRQEDGGLAAPGASQMRLGSRGMDRGWSLPDRSGKAVIVTLLPVTDRCGAQRFLARLRPGDVIGSPAGTPAAGLTWSLDRDCRLESVLAQLCARYDIELPAGSVLPAAQASMETVA